MNVRRVSFLRRSIVLATFLCGYAAANAWAQAPLTYTWINPATGGIWSDPSQWSDITADGLGDVADGAGNTADFSTLNLTANNTVTMDADHTLGFLIFGDTTPSNNWIVNNPGILTLATVAPNTTPAITVNNQTATLNTIIAGTQGFNKAGNGTLLLSTGSSTITGPINVLAGTFGFDRNGTVLIPANTRINLNAGTTFTFNAGTNFANTNMANLVFVVNSNATAGNAVTLNGAGYQGSSVNDINYLVTGNGNLNWGFSAALNVINTNMLRDFGGTVNFGSRSLVDRAASGNQTLTMQFATIDFGTGNGGWSTRGGNLATFLMGGLAGSNGTSMGNATVNGEVLVVGSANASQTFSGRLFQPGTASAITATVTKVGSGTWTVNPNAIYGTNALNLNANGGTFVADFSNLATPTNLFTPASILGFGGGTFNLLAKNSGATRKLLATLR